MNVIETSELVRYFGATRAVAGLDLQVPRGSIFGLLGENGCGKTTTLNLIMGALIPNQGRVRVMGEDPLTMAPATRARIGYLADQMEVPSWMTLQEAVRIHGAYFADWDPKAVWQLLDTSEVAPHQRFGHLSKGQKRWFLIALIVAQSPDLLILDEPSGGLDVTVRRKFLDLLLELASQREITVVIASHILSDVERVVDHVAFVKEGRVVQQSLLEDLKTRVKRLCLPVGTRRQDIEKRFQIISYQVQSEIVLATVSDFEEERTQGLSCRVEHLNLEELFLIYNTSSDVKQVAS